MLMTSITAPQTMCPLSAGREKPFACRWQGCAAFRAFDIQGEPLREPEGAVLHYCGQVGRPGIAQVRVQFPKLFSTVLTDILPRLRGYAVPDNSGAGTEKPSGDIL